MSKFTRLLTAALVLLMASASVAPLDAQETRRRDPNRITQQEIEEARASDPYSAIRTLRPAWLNRRGSVSMRGGGTIRVYVDGMSIGGPESLRSLPITSVAQMQYLNAAQATERWGTDHAMGAILVRTR